MTFQPFLAHQLLPSLPVRTKPGSAGTHRGTRFESEAWQPPWLIISSNEQATSLAINVSTNYNQPQRLIIWASGCSRASRKRNSRKTCSAAVGFHHPQTGRWQHSIVLHRSQDDNLSSLNAELAAVNEAIRQTQMVPQDQVDEVWIFSTDKSTLRHLIPGYGNPLSASCTRIVEEIRGRVQDFLTRPITLNICWVPKKARIVPHVRVHKLAKAYLRYATESWPVSGCSRIRWESISFIHDGKTPSRWRLANALKDYFNERSGANDCCVFIDSNLAKASRKKSARQQRRLLEKKQVKRLPVFEVTRRCGKNVQESNRFDASLEVPTAKKVVLGASVDKGRSEESKASIATGVEGEGEVQDDWEEVTAEDGSAKAEAQVVIEREGTCRVS